MKHIAEQDIGYVANGVFIAAAIIAGYPYELCAPNARFGMSETSFKKLQRIQREAEDLRSASSVSKVRGQPLGRFFQEQAKLTDQLNPVRKVLGTHAEALDRLNPLGRFFREQAELADRLNPVPRVLRNHLKAMETLSKLAKPF
jgi:hypothetical protein